MTDFASAFKPDQHIIYTAGIETMRDYKEGNVRHRAPKIKLVVNPFFLPFVPVEILGKDLGGLILSCLMSKSRSEPGGEWTVVMACDSERIQSSGLGALLLAGTGGRKLDIQDLFQMETLCYLYMDGYLQMQGTVQKIRKTTDPDQGRILTVTFYELGRVYERTPISASQILMGGQQSLVNDPQKILNQVAWLAAGVRLPDGIYQLVNAFIMSTLNFGLKGFPNYQRMSDGLPLAFRLVAQKPPWGAISANTLLEFAQLESSMFDNESSSFWQYLKYLAPDPWAEMFTETGGRTICMGPVSLATAGVGMGLPDQILNGAMASGTVPGSQIFVQVLAPFFNYLVVRPTPYSSPLMGMMNPAYSWLRAVTMSNLDLLAGGDFAIITEADVLQKDLGYSQEGQATSFYADLSGTSPTNYLNRPSIAYGPLLPTHPGGARTYGFRGYTASIKAWSAHLLGIGTELSQYYSARMMTGALSSLLNYWFRNASKFREGTIILTPSKRYIRPGMVLMYVPTLDGDVDDPKDICLYYVDNVNQEYMFGANDTTTLTVCRGMPIPLHSTDLVSLLAGWELFPPGLNITDGETW